MLSMLGLGAQTNPTDRQMMHAMAAALLRLTSAQLFLRAVHGSSC